VGKMLLQFLYCTVNLTYIPYFFRRELLEIRGPTPCPHFSWSGKLSPFNKENSKKKKNTEKMQSFPIKHIYKKYFRYAALLEDENKGGQNLFLTILKLN
jgi:hypothetical protein